MTGYIRPNDQKLLEAIQRFAKDHKVSIVCGFGGGAYFCNQDMENIETTPLDKNDICCFLESRWGFPFRLELGSGRAGEKPPWGKLPWATLDINSANGPNADLYKDLEIDWFSGDVDWSKDEEGDTIPLPDECVSEIHCNQVLEHIVNIIPLMNDCYRVLVPGGFMKIGVPYYLGPDAWGDPGHVRAFSEHSFRYYCRREDGTQFASRFSDDGITAMFVLERNEHNRAGITAVLRKPQE